MTPIFKLVVYIRNKIFGNLLYLYDMEKVLNIPSFSFFNNDWELLLKYVESRGNPPFHVEGDLNLDTGEYVDLGTLVSVGGDLDLSNTEIYSLENIVKVGGTLKIPYGLYNLGDYDLANKLSGKLEGPK
jgi:hypothetical protein